MSVDETARRGAELARSATYAPASAPGQLPPVGPQPTPDLLLVGALLWSIPAVDPRPVLALVADDDVADPALALVLGVVRAMLAAGAPVSPVLVVDQLRRGGEPSKPVADRLMQATAAGAVPFALRAYAAAVVAGSLRRRFESAGAALTAAAAEVAEADLGPMAERAAAAVVDCADRLAALRGGE